MRLIVCYLGAAGLLILAGLMVAWAFASRYAALANYELIGWAGHPAVPPDPPSRARIEKLLRRALALDPSNPEYHDRLSQFYLLQAIAQGGTGADQAESIDAGMKEARRAIAGRPGYPLAWARLLVWKAGTGALDQEFRLALERTTTLGRWHFAIHAVVLNATLPVWSSLTPADRDIVLDTGVRGLQQSPDATLPILQRFDRLKAVCQRIGPNAALQQQYCQSL